MSCFIILFRENMTGGEAGYDDNDDDNDVAEKAFFICTRQHAHLLAVTFLQIMLLNSHVGSSGHFTGIFAINGDACPFKRQRERTEVLKERRASETLSQKAA